MEALRDAQGALVDFDGTLVTAGALVPGAAELMAAFGDRCVVVSNDAEHTPAELAADLATLGIEIPPGRIVLAGALAIEVVARERPGAGVLLLASPALEDHARRVGLDPDVERPEIVIVGRDRRFSFARLAAAANAARGGAALVVANPDRTHPGPGRGIVPETGALASAILACTGPIPYRVIGKPEPALFLAGLSILGLEPAQAVMIGDNPETDGLGAERVGMRFLLARNGRLPDTSARAPRLAGAA
mgnify:FL=1